MSKFGGVKTDNAKNTAKNTAKIAIRNDVLTLFGDDSRVLDVFCGKLQMYDEVWHKCSLYKGVDIRKVFVKGVDTHCCDNLKYIKFNDIREFNIFDIDSYGSPYIQLYEILNQLVDSDAGRVGFCITDGVNMDMKMGRVCAGVRLLSGIKENRIKKIHKNHDNLIKIIIMNCAKMLNKRVIYSKISKGVTGASMRYYAFVLD